MYVAVAVKSVDETAMPFACDAMQSTPQKKSQKRMNEDQIEKTKKERQMGRGR